LEQRKENSSLNKTMWRMKKKFHDPIMGLSFACLRCTVHSFSANSHLQVVPVWLLQAQPPCQRPSRSLTYFSTGNEHSWEAELTPEHRAPPQSPCSCVQCVEASEGFSLKYKNGNIDRYRYRWKQ
jgi:hypothetical protein